MTLKLYGNGNIENVDSITTSASATLSATELGNLDGVTGSLLQDPGAWTSYTPTLTASTTSPTLGSGSIAEGQYIKIGKLVVGSYLIRFGTSGINTGSGTYRVSLPSTISEIITGNQYIYGGGYIYDSNAGLGRILNHVYSNGLSYATLGLLETTTNVFSNVTNSSPWTWAASDEIQGNFMYLEAS
jgi:hypothetical protein